MDLIVSKRVGATDSPLLPRTATYNGLAVKRSCFLAVEWRVYLTPLNAIYDMVRAKKMHSLHGNHLNSKQIMRDVTGKTLPR